MLKNKVIVLSLILVVLLSACSNTNQSGGGASASGNEAVVNESQEPETPVEEELDDDPDEPVYVADAAMYRGVITNIEKTDEGATVELSQVEGTDFGSPTLSVELNSDTMLGFDLESMSEGDYLEVYYGMPMGGGVQEKVSAIGVNRLPDADLSIYNGTIQQMEINETGGSLLLQGRDENDTILFFFDEETQIYLTLDELKEGDRVNVYFSGATTRSIPPQATALEIRPYREP